jgi:hypothetical protein
MLEQAHRWPHADEHLIEVDEDSHQREGVQRQVLKLEAVVLQQREEEGGRWERVPSKGIRCKEDELIGLQVGEQNGFASHPPIMFRRLPTKQSPQSREVIAHQETGGKKTSLHCSA